MTATAVGPAPSVPGPPELLPGRPGAVLDLQTAEGCALVGGQWRYADARVREIGFVELAGPGAADPLGPGDVPNRTYDIEPHAEGVDFDDSGWAALAPEETMRRLATGRVCFNWYRIAITVPEVVDGRDPTGTTVVFEVVVDDYAEVWVDGKLPVALGDSGGQVVAGFNAPNRVVLTRDARPGQRFVIAVFGINGPISASPRNYIWLRTASLEFHPPRRERDAFERVAAGFDSLTAPAVAPDGGVLFSSTSTGAIYRYDPDLERVTVFRAKSWATALAFSGDGLLLIGQDDRTLRVNPHGDVTVLAGGLRVPAPDGEGPDLPEPTTGLALGAGDLYATTPTSLYRIRRNP
jgi:gluconolactonase